MGSFPVESLILAALAAIVAFFIGRLTSKDHEDTVRLQEELKENKKALQNYRKQVTSHFRGTAQKVDAMTQSYRDVYKHLAQGAQELCEQNEAPKLLNDPKRAPMLGEETNADSEGDREEATVEPGSEEAQSEETQPESEAEKSSGDSEKSRADVADEVDAKATEAEKGRDIDTDDSEVSLKDEPDAAAEEPDEPEAQKSEQKSAA